MLATVRNLQVRGDRGQQVRWDLNEDRHKVCILWLFGLITRVFGSGGRGRRVDRIGRRFKSGGRI
jgi:hypothetical protein